MGSRKSDKPRARAGSGKSRPSRGRAPRRQETFRPAPGEPAEPADDLSALDHYRREKARRGAARTRPDSDPLEEARREYRAMLEADAARQKGGRPRKTAARKTDSEAGLDEDVDSVEDLAAEAPEDVASPEGEPEGEEE